MTDSRIMPSGHELMRMHELAELRDERDALRAENTRLRELYENVVINRERFGWTINHLMEADEAVRTLEAELEELRRAEAVLVAADRLHEAYGAMLEGRDVGRLPDWQPRDGEARCPACGDKGWIGTGDELRGCDCIHRPVIPDEPSGQKGDAQDAL